MTGHGPFATVTLALGSMALITGFATAVARHSFSTRLGFLQRSLEQGSKALTPREDLPLEVLALARRLGVFRSEGGRRLVRLTQIGKMWMKPGSKPLAFKADQTIAAAQIGFLWRAWFVVAGMSMLVVDYTVGGKAGLEGRLLGALPLVRMAGTDTLFRGEAMRYLAELMWNPDALLLNRQLDWRVLNTYTLAVATGQGTRRCEVRLILDESGDLVGMEADDRPRQNGRMVTNSPWFGRASDYRMIGGRRIPTEAEVGWLLDGVEFIYWRGKVTSWSIEV